MAETEGMPHITFRASVGGNAVIVLAALGCVVGAWAISQHPNAPSLIKAFAILVVLAGLVVAVIKLKVLIERPVMADLSSDGLFLKNHNQTIPWEAIAGVRENAGGKHGAVIELVPVEPLHDVLTRGSLRLGRSANMMAGLPQYCFAMTGMIGSNAEFLSAAAHYTIVMEPVASLDAE